MKLNTSQEQLRYFIATCQSSQKIRKIFLFRLSISVPIWSHEKSYKTPLRRKIQIDMLGAKVTIVETILWSLFTNLNQWCKIQTFFTNRTKMSLRTTPLLRHRFVSSLYIRFAWTICLFLWWTTQKSVWGYLHFIVKLSSFCLRV